MKPKVSVVVPVYGVEKYIERCARSLFEQTFNEIEFVFVNDCTKDSSMEILYKVMEEYPSCNKRVKFIQHDKNKGLPQARRTGILSAEGEYVINFDSDDWVDKTIIERMYKRAKEDSSDIVVCDIINTDGHNQHIIKGYINQGKDGFIRDLCSFRIMWSVCNKLIKRSLFSNDFVFPTCNNGEDLGFMIPLTIKANVISHEPTPLYYYYHNPESMTHVINERIVFERFQMFLENTSLALKAFEKAGLSDKYRNSIDTLKLMAKSHLYGLVYSRKYRIIWKHTFSEINIRVVFNGEVSFSNKIKYILTLLRVYPQRKNRIPIEKESI